jgi:hypothetical protein
MDGSRGISPALYRRYLTMSSTVSALAVAPSDLRVKALNVNQTHIVMAPGPVT